MDFLDLLMDSINSFGESLQSFIDILDAGIRQLSAGNINLPTELLDGGSDGVEPSTPSNSIDDTLIYKYIGGLRYLIGDQLFLFIWIIINIGVLYSIFKLILLLKDLIGGAGGIFNTLGTFLKGKKWKLGGVKLPF